ncbi:MAG: RdgB/HAM1 family non-canonical purine NTP pyrophosphatase [Patescibacteria group bacterium]
MKKLVIASQNLGKLKEIKQLLSDLSIEIVIPEKDLDVEETGSTFEENAMLKAKAYQQLFPEFYILADDSGLEVDALDGRPGVYSKRYGTSDQDRNQKLLNELESVPDEKRTARFISVMVLLGPTVHQIFQGTVEGSIARTIAGDQGFGYDPVFIPVGYTKSFAELGSEIKNTMSHRAKCLEKVKLFLKTTVTE